MHESEIRESCAECGNPIRESRLRTVYGSIPFCSVAHRDAYLAKAVRS